MTRVISTHSKLKKKPRMHYFKMNSYWHFDEKVHFWNALILQVHVMWMPILNNVSFCIPVCLKILYFFSWQNQLVLNKCKLMRITYCFIFSLTVILMPQRHRRAARNLTVTVMISVTVIMTAWVTENDNYPMTIIIWLARVILMVPGWGGHWVFPLANNWIISYLFIYSVSEW